VEIVGWAGVTTGAIVVLAAMCPLPWKRRRQATSGRLVAAAMGFTAIGSEGQDLRWSDRLETPLAAAALVLWAVAVVSVVRAGRNRRG
jgi:threonine/homoserine efflux transporter RhtA